MIPKTASRIIHVPLCPFKTERKIKSIANNPAMDNKKNTVCPAFMCKVSLLFIKDKKMKAVESIEKIYQEELSFNKENESVRGNYVCEESIRNIQCSGK
ncbi:MAG: hypothetical protein QM737_13730 [Ferruginibacter sp.]